MIKPSAAKRYQAVPVGFVGGGLLVAMADPADALGVNDIAVMTKLEVQPAVATRPALDALLERLPLQAGGGRRPERRRREAPAEAGALVGGVLAGRRGRRRRTGARPSVRRSAAGERSRTARRPSGCAASSWSCVASWWAPRPSW